MVGEQTPVRITLPEPIDAVVSGFPVRLRALGTDSAQIEHEQRLPLEKPHLRLQWRGSTLDSPISIARSEIIAKRGASLVYQSDVRFQPGDIAQDVIATIVEWAKGSGSVEAAIEEPAVDLAIGETAVDEPVVDLTIEVPDEASIEPEPRVAPTIALEPLDDYVPPPDDLPAASKAKLEDSWTRNVSFLKRDAEEDLPFAQYRLTANGWVKEHVDSPAQPEEGFTIRSDDHDFAELQKTYELADPDTRRMMKVALESKLGR